MGESYRFALFYSPHHIYRQPPYIISPKFFPGIFFADPRRKEEGVPSFPIFFFTNCRCGTQKAIPYGSLIWTDEDPVGFYQIFFREFFYLAHTQKKDGGTFLFKYFFTICSYGRQKAIPYGFLIGNDGGPVGFYQNFFREFSRRTVPPKTGSNRGHIGRGNIGGWGRDPMSIPLCQPLCCSTWNNYQ